MRNCFRREHISPSRRVATRDHTGARLYGVVSTRVSLSRFHACWLDDIQTTQLFPLAAPVWQDARLMLPPEETGRQYCNLFTSEQLSPSDYEGQPTLLLAEVFARFPVALLSTRHEERTGT